MHPAVAQTFFIFSIFYLVLAAPIVMQDIHEARKDKIVVAEDVAIKLALDRTMSPRSPPGSEPSSPHSSSSGDPLSLSGWDAPDFPSSSNSQPRPESSHDSASPPRVPPLSPSSAMELPSNPAELAPEMPPPWFGEPALEASPSRPPHYLYSSGESVSPPHHYWFGVPAPEASSSRPLHYLYLSGESAPEMSPSLRPPVSDMPPPPHPLASLHYSEYPSSPSSKSSEITEMTLPERLQEFAPSQERPPPPPPPPAGSASSASPQHAGSSPPEMPEMPLPEWLQEFAPSQERPPPPPPPPAGSASSASPQHAGSSPELPETSLLEWLQEFERLGYH